MHPRPLPLGSGRLCPVPLGNFSKSHCGAVQRQAPTPARQWPPVDHQALPPVRLGPGHLRRLSSPVFLSPAQKVGTGPAVPGGSQRPRQVGAGCMLRSRLLDSIFFHCFLQSPDRIQGSSGNHPAGATGWHGSCLGCCLHLLLFPSAIQ